MQLYNTIHRKKETFTPRLEGKVGMYVCGITAYDLCHIGHARSTVVFDVLVRFLRHLDYDVTFVRNFTDVDDKIINRANEEGLDSREVAKKYIAAFHEDMDALNILRADVEPKATEHIEEMVALANTLVDKHKAYSTPSGDVYFRVRAHQGYGKLSGRDIEDLEAGARVAPGEEKEDPLDFALWKGAKPGEPFWPSPWGNGRPGWHLECSAMSEKYLGLPLDIHGGGQDLIFPHHENELAQTEAACNKDFARYWVHNGFVRIDSEKMSKSLGNFKTIRDIMAEYLPETIRFFLLTKHYRSPIDFTFEAMEEAEKNLKRIYETKAKLETELTRSKWGGGPFPEEPGKELTELQEQWLTSMNDDLNTAAALGHVFGVVRLGNRLLEEKSLRKNQAARELFSAILQDLNTWGGVLGVFTQESKQFLTMLRDRKAARAGIDQQVVEDLVQRRQEARKSKDFELSDILRQELLAMAVEVQDTPDGPVWDIV
jgi:cysteinyl-tRNA synthetase